MHRATSASGWVEDTSTVCDHRGHAWTFVGATQRWKINPQFDEPYWAKKRESGDYYRLDYPQRHRAIPVNTFQCAECGVRKSHDA